LKIFQQGFIEKFQAEFDLEFSSVIVIAIENVSRIDRSLIESGLAGVLRMGDWPVGVGPGTMIPSQIARTMGPSTNPDL
jgi:hypothetical protein